MTYEEREREFMRELSALTKKHGVVVSGCGCCGSPALEDLVADEADAGYAYVGHVRWVTPSDVYEWNTYGKEIVK